MLRTLEEVKLYVEEDRRTVRQNLSTQQKRTELNIVVVKTFLNLEIGEKYIFAKGKDTSNIR